MHKITKGLKKKKKGKKSKKGEEELFKPEELENYRREHQGASEEPAAQNEEWKKFLALTSGVDDILKKTQGDLDRIRSTSFFQRKPTESEVRKVNEQKLAEEKRRAEAERETELPTAAQLGIVEVSESESEEEEDDNIFDTTYIDALEAADLKLAYIPESPIEKVEGDDPFDTSIAERAILGPEVERKGKKLVPLGAAVEVLTGRVQLPTCATKRPISNRRQVLKQRDLLLGSFDGNINVDQNSAEVNVVEEIPKTLLDEDPLPLGDAPIDLSKPIPFPQAVPVAPASQIPDKQDIILDEFDVIRKIDDEDDIEFEALAAESLSKTAVTIQSLPVTTVVNSENIKFGAFEEELRESNEEQIEDDPFDTAFVEEILPCAERKESDIKHIEHDFLGESDINLPNATSTIVGFNINIKDDFSDDDFDPRANDSPRERTVSRPDVLNICNNKTVSFDIPSPDHDTLGIESKIIKPLTPFYTRKSSIPELSVSDDPFDTSFASNVAPGKAELKIIESELFDPNVEKNLNLVDRNFDPRDEIRAKIDKVVDTINEISNPKAQTTPDTVDLLAIENDISTKVLTPGALETKPTEELSYRDPFDTSSIASNILPGRTELKLLETELISSEIKGSETNPSDLLVHNADEIIDKPLSPSAEFNISPVLEEEDYDPFDTSCITNPQPGRAELRLLESEFIQNGC